MTTLLFSGHRVDEVGRHPPRLPPHRCAIASKLVTAAVAELDQVHKIGRGVAGAANGGDILFHESCQRLGIETEVFLALPKDQYLVRSVRAEGAQGWERRFERIIERAAAVWTYPWDQTSPLWEGAASWMVQSAFERTADPPQLLALWDRTVSRRPGGTSHLVACAKQRGAPVTVIDTTTLGDKW